MTTTSLHILIADDDYTYCLMLKKAITNRGHFVEIATSGEEAFKKLESEIKFDAVLLDYKMEGINGINVLQWMYSKKISIPVILITAYGDEEIFEEAFKWGALEYFIKGEMDIVRLPILVEQVFHKHQKRKFPNS